MLEFIWLFFISTPPLLLPTNFSKNSIKTKIIFSTVFYILLYSNIGYALQFLKIPINFFSVLITIGIVDSIFIFCLIKNNKIDIIKNFNLKKYKEFSKIDIGLSLILFFSFFLYYYNQSRFFSLVAPDAWYWFSGLNFIANNGFLFYENSLWEFDILYWYPDGFHYLWGITFLPFSATLSYNVVKIIGPLFGVLSLLGLWEYFSENKSYLILASLIYTSSMFYLVHRFSMFIPEGMSIFIIVSICLIIKRYELNSKSIIILAIIFGLFTNIYHSIGLILFFIIGLMIIIYKIPNEVSYLFIYVVSSLFFLLPYIFNYEGILTYLSHLEHVAKESHLWINYIKASGIVFFAKPGVKETVIGFPLSVIYPAVIIKTKLKDRSIIFSSILMIFSICLGISYLFWKSNLSSRSLVLFSISSALLFPFFIRDSKSILNKFFRKHSDKIMHVLLILILINRLLIISFAFPEIDSNIPKTENTKIILWMDDNLPLDSIIIIEEDFYAEWGLTQVTINRILYPRKIVVNEENYATNSPTYRLFYEKSPLRGSIIHNENNLILVEEE